MFSPLHMIVPVYVCGGGLGNDSVYIQSGFRLVGGGAGVNLPPKNVYRIMTSSH